MERSHCYIQLSVHCYKCIFCAAQILSIIASRLWTNLLFQIPGLVSCLSWFVVETLLLSWFYVFSSWIWLLLNDLSQILGRAHPQMRCQLQGQHSHRQTFNQLFSNQELMLLCCLKVLSFSALVLCLAQNCCLILNTFYLKCQHFWLVVGSLGDCCNCQFFFLTLLYVKHFLVIKDIFMRDDELIINFFS